MDNGLVCPEAFSNPQTPYYIDQQAENVIVEPILVSPVVLRSEDLTSQARIECRGGDPTPGPVIVPVPGPFTGAIKLLPGASSVGAAAEGMTIRSLGGGTQVLVGTDSQSPNSIVIAGPDGLGQVYDVVYNPVIKLTSVAAASGALPDTTGFTFTPERTGAYMLQVNINVRNTDSIPLVGFIEWVLSAAGEEVQFVSNTVNSNELIKVLNMNEINGQPGAIAEPTDFSTSDLCILQAGVPVSFGIFTARDSTVGGLPWAIENYQARLIQLC